MHFPVMLAVHVTAILVVAYFVFYMSSRVSGLASLLGKLLALWIVVLAGGICAMHCMGYGPYGGKMDGRMRGWMHPERIEAPATPEKSATPEQPAAPAAPEQSAAPAAPAAP
jgi:hypothetical protein